jgi:malate dehydrogenase (oxaloacetate-decarboxylating)(NADP+)
MSLRDEALEYHRRGRPGKIEVAATKPLTTQYDLSLAYSPGVAEPCREIAADPDASFEYTARGNMVAVVTDGTAVLGLGSIGPEASKPVMEGKAVLFKRFAGVDGIDLELRRTSVDQFVDAVAALEPSFGGINLEDIKAPECFEIERRLKERMAIPVMHDDQHGTAIITGAGLINACEIAGKPPESLQVVVVGAGAAALACTRFFVTLGVQREHVIMLDRDGVLRRNDPDRDPHQPGMEFATERPVSSLEEALEGADVLLGLSVGNILSPEQLKRMAPRPIVFAMANPDPEIDPERAKEVRPDIIIATGRSDVPNQVNNVLGFPYIFRGALDVGAREINDEMKTAAARAIARLAREPIPTAVSRVYSHVSLTFGKEYILPKPLDPRLITAIAPAVARAAIETGVARRTISDWPQYEARLLERIGMGQKLITGTITRARENPKRVVFPEGSDYEVLKAADMAADQGIAYPILLGPEADLRDLIDRHNLRSLSEARIIDPATDTARSSRFAAALFRRRQRRGLTHAEALQHMREYNYFAAGLVESGEADAMVSGRTRPYPQIIRPTLQTIGTREGVHRVSGMYVVNTRQGTFFFADTTVNVDPDMNAFMDIIELTIQRVRDFDIEPVVALLSYSNFGSAPGDQATRMADVAARARERFPEVTIDGEIQANVALDPELLEETYPFSHLVGRHVNTLIFPNLSSGNIAYKLLARLGGGELMGPILTGLRKPVHILQMGADAREILQMTAVAVLDAQRHG